MWFYFHNIIAHPRQNHAFPLSPAIRFILIARKCHETLNPPHPSRICTLRLHRRHAWYVHRFRHRNRYRTPCRTRHFRQHPDYLRQRRSIYRTRFLQRQQSEADRPLYLKPQPTDAIPRHTKQRLTHHIRL